MTEWISVSERLPKSNEIVLIFTHEHDIYVAMWDKIWPEDNNHYWNICCECIDAEGIFAFDVTHWMPLPEPPSEFKYTYSEIGTATGFRWLKADGSVGHLKAGETMSLPEPPK